MDAIETETVGPFTVTVEYDPDPMDPREDDNLGTMVCWHRGYDLGDTTYHNRDTDPTPAEVLAESPKGSIVLPLFLIDHSGLAMSTSSFAWCDPGEWDSGQVGFIYATPAKIRESWMVKRITARVREQATASLRGEVQTYDQYLQGQVCGYVVSDARGDVEESCWGFYGSTDDALAEGRSVAGSLLAELAESLDAVRDWREGVQLALTVSAG